MNRRKRILYNEGEWFAIPLTNGGYAIGIIARKARRGALMGYFFGPRRDQIPTVSSLADIQPQDALCISMFGDLGILYGDWPIIGASRQWDRTKWPVPDFGRIDSINPAVGYRTTYNDNDISQTLREVRVSAEEANALPPDILSGWLAMEAHLRMKIG